MCHDLKSKNRLKDPEAKAKRNRSINLWHKRRRKDPTLDVLAKVVVRDCKKLDRKHHRQNDLSLAFVQTVLSKPCTYCGEPLLRMTLDRIDNNLGHTEGNVVGACIRCNYARRSMPYEAWLLLAPAMRAARESGLFGSWTGRCR